MIGGIFDCSKRVILECVFLKILLVEKFYKENNVKLREEENSSIDLLSTAKRRNDNWITKIQEEFINLLIKKQSISVPMPLDALIIGKIRL